MFSLPVPLRLSCSDSSRAMVRDWLDESESEVWCVRMWARLSAGRGWALTVRSRMLNQLSSPDHRDTESDTSKDVQCVHKQHYNSTSAERCLWKDQKREWSIVKNVTWFHLWALSISNTSNTNNSINETVETYCAVKLNITQHFYYLMKWNHFKKHFEAW